MKSSVGCKKWIDSIKPKMRTSYLTVLSIAEFLGIKLVDVITYTTYERDKFEVISENADLKVHTPLLGKPLRDPYKDEWEKNTIILNIDGEFMLPHKKIQMVRNSESGVLEGTLTI